MKVSSLLAVLGVLVLAACSSTGPRVPSPTDPFGMPVNEFQQETTKLRANLKKGEPRKLSEEEWTEFDGILNEMDELVGDARELDQIAMEYRYKLYDLRSDMLSLLVGDIQDEVVCITRQTTGTRLKRQRRCYTLAQLEAERFEAETLMRYIDSLPQGMDAEGGF